MRSFDEILADIEAAASGGTAHALRAYAEEMFALGTTAAQAYALAATGMAYIRDNDHQRAFADLHHAIALLDELGDQRGKARVTGTLGVVTAHTGDYPKAIEYYQRALRMLEDLQDVAGVSRITTNIGAIYCLIGDFPLALEQYHKALHLAESIGDLHAVARCTVNISIVYNDIGEHEQAIQYAVRALKLSEEIGYTVVMAHATGALGSAYSDESSFERSLQYKQEAIALFREVNDPNGIAHYTVGAAWTLVRLERFDEAHSMLDDPIVMSIKDPNVRAWQHDVAASIAEHRGDLEAAKGHLQHALALASDAGLRKSASEYHLKLRDLAQRRNDFADYVEHNGEYQRIMDEIRGQEATRKLTMVEAEKRIEAERAETEKHRALLHNTLPAAIADRVLRGETVNDSFESAAVMFMDMVGFTTMSATMSPDAVVQLLSEVFTTCDAIMAEHGLMKIKTIGDSYMAVAFSNTDNQTPNTSHVVSTATAAVEVLRTLSATHPDIQVRIGLHCGPVTAGVIGTERLQYDVWGDTVNTASRMESHGAPGRIHVSESFANALQFNDSMTNDSMTLHERGVIDIKGKGPMTTYWLETTAA